MITAKFHRNYSNRLIKHEKLTVLFLEKKKKSTDAGPILRLKYELQHNFKHFATWCFNVDKRLMQNRILMLSMRRNFISLKHLNVVKRGCNNNTPFKQFIKK